MNQLYRPRYILETTYNNKGNIENIKYETYGCYIKYGIPDENKNEITEWKDLLYHLNYCDNFEGHKDRKGRLWSHVDYTDKYHNRCQKKIYKDQFISAISYSKNKILNPKDIRMKTLVDELSAEEFILYLKDNGIGELPIQKAT